MLLGKGLTNSKRLFSKTLIFSEFPTSQLSLFHSTIEEEKRVSKVINYAWFYVREYYHNIWFLWTLNLVGIILKRYRGDLLFKIL